MSEVGREDGEGDDSNPYEELLHIPTEKMTPEQVQDLIELGKLYVQLYGIIDPDTLLAKRLEDISIQRHLSLGSCN